MKDSLGRRCETMAEGVAAHVLGGKPLAVDNEAEAIYRESITRFFGFNWPDGVGFEEGCLRFIKERVAYWDDRVRRGR